LGEVMGKHGAGTISYNIETSHGLGPVPEFWPTYVGHYVEINSRTNLKYVIDQKTMPVAS